VKKKIADKWVAALRSGKYEQGKGYLKRENKYCCLGVLCDLCGKKPYPHLKYLPQSVMKWSGIKNNAGLINGDGYLTSENDAGKTFPEIATIIEENWKKL
jgi:hypothetical protein